MQTVNRKPFDLWTKNDSHAFTRRLAFFCAQRSGRFAETLCNLVSDDRTDDLCTFSIDYLYTDTARELSYARQTLAFYSKDADLETREASVMFWNSFKDSEMLCRATNNRLSSLFQSDILYTCAGGIFYDVQCKIIEILGEAPLLADIDFAFGPGTNVGIENKIGTSPRCKLDCVPTCSESLAPLVVTEIAHALPLYLGLHRSYVVVKGKVGSVPKNAKTRRSIIIEPLLNGGYQTGIGGYIKRQLLSFGLNLYDQTRNQRLAREGSINGDLVTLDLSNASNTVALMLVYHLMSEDWFNLLDLLRTSQVEYKGVQIDLEMFSSMGNGFTFELESLIFYAIALTVAAKVGRETGFPIDTSKISVFGDDIIVPKRMDRELRLTLKLFGFQVNNKKSFSQGPFRESCGVDYFLGVNIRPFYKKDRWTNARVVGLLNYDYAHGDLFAELREELIVYSLNNGYCYGPPGYGDGHIHIDESFEDDLPPYKLTKKPERKVPEFGKVDEKSFARASKQRTRYGTLDGYFFTSIIKTQFKSYDDCLKGDQLLPAYSASLLPPLKGKKTERWRLAYDVFGLSHVVTWDEVKRYQSVSHESEELKRLKFDSSDPFTIRGGYKSKEVKIYMFKGS